jgi:hypothetical protein
MAMDLIDIFCAMLTGDGLSIIIDANLAGSADSGNGLGIVATDGDGVSGFILDLDSDNAGVPDISRGTRRQLRRQ